MECVFVASPAVQEPIARSSIKPAEPVVVRDGWEVSARTSSSGLTLSDATALAKVLVKADANCPFTASALAFGRAMRHRADDGGRVLEVGSGPGEWLHIGPPGTSGMLAAKLRATTADANEFISVVDLTHGRALMRLTGDHGPSLMAKICAIDLSDAATPDLAAFRSSVAKTVTDVVRDDRSGRRSYLLHCERSSGQYLFDCILDAGQEFGIDVSSMISDPAL